MAIEDFDQVTIAAAHIRPFSKFIMSIGEMPTSYLDSLSYAEQITWFCNFLQDKVIPAINNNAEALEEVQNLMTQLQEYVDNYFTNLDVQEEINNKLDDMVEQGTLQEIIADYLNSRAVFGYDTVNDMKNSTNLINGSYAQTLGYYSKGDGGKALYKIRNITNEDTIDNAEIIALSNENLVAELIASVANVNAYGAYGDGIHDDSTAIQKAFNNSKGLSVEFNGKCTYLISSQITLTQHVIIRFNKALIKSTHQDGSIFISGNADDMQTIYDLNFDGNFISNYGLKVSDNRVLKGFNLYVKNCKLAGIYVFRNNNTGRGSVFLNEISVENQITTEAQYNAVADSIGIDIENTDSQIMNGNIKDCKKSIKCSSSTLVYGIHAWNYYPEFIKDGNIMVEVSGGLRLIGCYCDGIPTMVKQLTQTTYSNIDISSCIYHYVIGDQSIAQFTPVPIIKGTADKVNISNSTFETNFYNQNFAIANTFELLFTNNTFCSKAYYENYYKGSLTEEDKGTLTYERVNDVVYFKYDGIQAGTSDVSFTNRIPTWARPSSQIRFTPSGGGTNNVTITNNGEIQHVTTTAWASGQTSYPARYGLQKYNP